MDIRKIIREELDDFGQYGYYIDKLLSEYDEYIDKKRLGDPKYLLKYTLSVYETLTTRYFYKLADDMGVKKIIMKKITEKYITSIKEEVDDFGWTEDVPDNTADYLISQLSDEDRKHPWKVRRVLREKGYSDQEIMDTLAKHNPPRKRFKHEYDKDTVYWTTDHGSSTYQFNYPPRPNTLTNEFVNWIKDNPGGTKQDFYPEVLGMEFRRGHNGQFWPSIVASGILRVEKGRHGRYKFFIGPNYEKWTEGKLKRYMGMNIPWRYGGIQGNI